MNKYAADKKNRLTLKSTVQILCFLVTCVFVWQFASYMLVTKSGASYSSKTFDSIPENTVDAFFIGASSTWNGVSPLTLWQQTGMTSYAFAANTCPPQVEYLHLKEALKSQRPKVVFICTQFLVVKQKKDLIELRALQSMINRKLTIDKVITCVQIAKDVNVATGVKTLLPLLAYHDNWKNIQASDFFVDSDGEYMGENCEHFYHRNYTDTIDEMLVRSNPVPGKVYKYNEVAIKYYRKMIKLCKDNGIQPVLVTMPLYVGFKAHGALRNFADEEGIKYFNFNEPQYIKSINLDNTLEWRDGVHMNFWGAVKFSRWFGAFAEDKFDFPDRRSPSDPSYDVWFGHYSQFYEHFSRIMPNTFIPPEKIVAEK